MTTPDTSLPTSRYFTVQRVGESAWAAIAIPGTGSMGNAGVIDLGDLTVIFDTTLSLAAARDLRVVAERLTGQKAQYVVLSHHHIDHTMGAQVFDDATIISTPRTAEMMTQENEPFLAQMREQGMALDAEARAEAAAVSDPAIRRDLDEQSDDMLVLLQEANEARLRLPDDRILLTASEGRLLGPVRCFAVQQLELYGDGDARHAEVITWGGGHTPSDTVLYLPHARILYSGDLIFHQSHASISTGDPYEWLRILGEMEKLSVDTLVPGHGPVGVHGAIAAQRAYWQTILDLCRDALASGKTEDEAAATPAPAAYNGWIFPSGFSQTMRAVYAYLRDHPDAPDATKAGQP
jgi:glyoxylase-like metal-dependent hydrolase (beta-lactamase superfamily II)